MFWPTATLRMKRFSLSVLLPLVVSALWLSAPLPARPQQATPPPPATSASPVPPVAGNGSPSPAASPFSLPDPAATVNGEAISRAELERIATALLSANGRAPEDLSDAEKKKFYRAVAESLVTDRLVSKQAAGIKVEEAEVDKQLADLRAQVPPEQFASEIKRTGQTIDQIRSNLRAGIQQERWMRQAIGDDSVKVTDAEVEVYFKEHPEQFEEPETVRASHILIRVNTDATAEVAAEKEKLIASLAERVKKGESFAELAKKFSDDENSKDKGGDLGFFSRDRILPELADAAFQLKKDEVSAPVRTSFGWHLVKLTDRRVAHPVTLAEAKDSIRSYLETSNRREAASALIAKLHAAAKIEIFVP